MTGTQIGDIVIPVIENIDISSSESKEEIDLIGEDEMLILEGSEAADAIDIDFALTEQNHSSRDGVEDQRSNVKELVSSESAQNDFKYQEMEGYISVESISVPQDPTQSNYIQGTISGRYLPWPKHYPNNKPTIDWIIGGITDVEYRVGGEFLTGRIFTGSNVDYYFEVDSESAKIYSIISSYQFIMDLISESHKLYSISQDLFLNLDFNTYLLVRNYLELEVNYTQSILGDLYSGHLLDEEINLVFDTDIGLSEEVSIGGDLYNSIIFDVIPDAKYSSCGFLFYAYTVSGESYIQKSTELISNYTLSSVAESELLLSSIAQTDLSTTVNGEMDYITTSFGRTFGRNFGGN